MCNIIFLNPYFTVYQLKSYKIMAEPITFQEPVLKISKILHDNGQAYHFPRTSAEKFIKSYMIMAEPTTIPEPVLKNFLWGSVFCKKKKTMLSMNLFPLNQIHNSH